MAEINNTNVVKEQYKDSGKLNTRISIHDKYSTNKQGFGNWITSNYDIKPGMKVLELGCGTGSMWVGQEDKVALCSKLILSDFSEGMLDKTRETLKDISGIEYQVIDIQDIPYGDNEFDIVIANMMLYHVPDLSKGLSEVRRVLKDGGRFYCATLGENGIMNYVCGLFNRFNATNRMNTNFTLQNGEGKLKSVFDNAEKLIYEDSLAVTEVEDLADYIYSLGDMSTIAKLPRETVLKVLSSHVKDGVLNVPKEYGMFIAY